MLSMYRMPAKGFGKALCLLPQRRKSFPVLGPLEQMPFLLFSTQRHSVQSGLKTVE